MERHVVYGQNYLEGCVVAHHFPLFLFSRNNCRRSYFYSYTSHHSFYFFYTMTIAPPILFIPSPHYSNFDCDGRSAEKAKGSAQSIVLVTEQRVVDLLWVLAVGWFKAFLIGSPFLFLYFIHNSVHRLNFWESVSLWRFPKCSHSKMDVGGLVCVVLLLINGSGVMF